MPHSSEIEKLERRYAENPKGRNFAPLADAYRKAGQLDQAIELCTSGLEHHPDYVSAHIVYGRCLLDQHRDADAAEVFRKVLNLDSENVIAFKVLAEISTRAGRPDESVLWLTKLLAADPMNGDAAEALAVAKAKATQGAGGATSGPVVRAPVASVMPRKPPAPASPPAIILDPEPDKSADLPVEARQSSSDIEVYDGTLDFNSVASSTAKADGIEISEEIVMQPSKLDVEGLARTQYEASGVFKLDAEPEEEEKEEDLGAVDLPFILPDAAEETRPREDAATPAPPTIGSPRGSAPQRAAPLERHAPPPSTGMPAAVTLSDDDGAADTAALSRVEPFLTETMAELFLRQGHPEEALRVYQALQAQHPGDGRLRAKVEALSGGGTGGRGRGGEPRAPSGGETAQAFLKGILARRPGVTAGAEPPGTSPLDSAFAATAPDPDAPGEPTRAASDDFSLDAVFGDESQGAGGPAARQAPAPTAEPAPAPRAPTPPGGFSFDEFFSARGAPGPAASPAVPPSAPPASGSRARPQVEEDNDLDQFQRWLKGLKS